jgi:predicted transposase/invertase (TIGR01784 family)
MSIGISPLIDYALKMLLGNEDHINILLHFLNTILVGQPEILTVTIKNPIQNKTRANDKLSILDILAVDELGRQLNIEVQTSIPAGLAKRLAYYTCVSYSRQLKRGQNYLTLRPSISICVLNGAMFSNPAKLHEEFRLQSTSSQLTLTEDLQIHLLQLNHLQVTAENLYTATAVERWAWFLRNVDQITVQDVARLFPDQVFSEAAGVLQMISKTPEQLMEYDARLKYQRDQSANKQEMKETMEALEATRSQLAAAATQLAAAATQLVATETQLVATETQLVATETQLAATETQLVATETQLVATETQLASTETQLASTETQLAATETQLAATETQLAATETQLAATETQLATAETQRQAAEAAAQAAQVETFNAKTQGLAIGQLRGQIILLQRLLQQRVWTEQDFESCDVDRLQAYADELQLHLGHRSLGD